LKRPPSERFEAETQLDVAFGEKLILRATTSASRTKFLTNSAFVENFKGCFGGECINEHLFSSLIEAARFNET
jgi:hypothetical protein